MAKENRPYANVPNSELILQLVWLSGLVSNPDRSLGNSQENQEYKLVREEIDRRELLYMKYERNKNRTPQ